MISICIWKVAQILTPSKSHDKGSLFAPHWGIIITNHFKRILVGTLNCDIYKNAELSFLQSLSRVWRCVHFSMHTYIWSCQSGFSYFTFNLYFCRVGHSFEKSFHTVSTQFAHSLHTVCTQFAHCPIISYRVFWHWSFCFCFFSRLTFFWLMPILKRGYHMPLEMSDLTPLPSNEKVICLKCLKIT